MINVPETRLVSTLEHTLIIDGLKRVLLVVDGEHHSIEHMNAPALLVSHFQGMEEMKTHLTLYVESKMLNLNTQVIEDAFSIACLLGDIAVVDRTTFNCNGDPLSVTSDRFFDSLIKDESVASVGIFMSSKETLKDFVIPRSVMRSASFILAATEAGLDYAQDPSHIKNYDAIIYYGTTIVIVK